MNEVVLIQSVHSDTSIVPSLEDEQCSKYALSWLTYTLATIIAMEDMLPKQVRGRERTVIRFVRNFGETIRENVYG